MTLPIGGDDFAAPVFAGRAAACRHPAQERHVGFQIVGARWFETLGMRVVGGRDFTAQDNHRDAPVAIVNQTLAAADVAGQDPIGRRLRSTSRTTVALVDDRRRRRPTSVISVQSAPPRPELYEPDHQNSLPFLAVAVRTERRPARDLSRPIRAAIAGLDPAQPISGVGHDDAII